MGSGSPAAHAADLQSTDRILVGTVGYMAPEQVRGLPGDHRGDIFSFGATFYEMVTGARAFERETAVETLNAILKHDPELDTATTAPAPAISRVIQRCLEKDPGQRFQSAHDLAFALGQLIGTSGSGRSWHEFLCRAVEGESWHRSCRSWSA